MALLRCLAGRTLGCGCLVGVYEQYNGSVIAVVDARGAACRVPEHALHARLRDVPAAVESDSSSSISDPRHDG